MDINMKLIATIVLSLGLLVGFVAYEFDDCEETVVIDDDSWPGDICRREPEPEA